MAEPKTTAEKSRFDLVNAIEGDLYDAAHLASLTSWIEGARSFIERAHFAATHHKAVRKHLGDVYGDNVAFGPEWQEDESEGLAALCRSIEKKLRTVRAEVSRG